MHRFAEAFKHNSNLRGGMALRLIDSPRSTPHIDYVFVPFSSKKDVRKRIVTFFAHELAAWNERRLLRDLCDGYSFCARLGETPAQEVLAGRLARVSSRIPGLSGCRSMTCGQFAVELRAKVESIDKETLDSELGGLVSEEETAGLALRMRAVLMKIVEWL